LTSPTGAAVKDVLRVSRGRFPVCGITVVPCNVQGDDAAPEIVRAFSRAARRKRADLVLLVRGGGSRDDLNPFDDERVVKAVRSCPIPVVTGLGHEIDSTLSDLAADAAAPTPSAAAEMVFPDRRAVISEISALRRHAKNGMDRRLDDRTWSVERSRTRLASLAERRLTDGETGLDAFFDALQRGINGRIDLETHHLHSISSTLEALSPSRVLSRGFITCETPEGTPVVSAASAGKEDHLRLVFTDGRVDVKKENLP
jgi:Exonuclease VII, large subunit